MWKAIILQNQPLNFEQSNVLVKKKRWWQKAVIFNEQQEQGMNMQDAMCMCFGTIKSWRRRHDTHLNKTTIRTKST